MKDNLLLSIELLLGILYAANIVIGSEKEAGNFLLGAITPYLVAKKEFLACRMRFIFSCASP
jgi:hypothetical protein